ncbi:molybdenum-dependent oxidoreductase-like protein [Phycicoccus sp. SLBN-51]|nr:molybdenum-dependent oxidoreductase-like protein [Phycicoccus sp. SLBN-51]
MVPQSKGCVVTRAAGLPSIRSHGMSLRRPGHPDRGRHNRAAALVAALAMVLATLPLLPLARAAAADPCTTPVSVIACENSKPGTPSSDWSISGAGSSTIQGFATSISVNPGDTVRFKINTPSKAYHFDILRLGYYQGNGARKLAANLKPSATLPQTQPSCLTLQDSTGLIDCGNWAVSASWTVPTDAVSGVYIAHLVRDDTTGASSHIVFIVKNDSSHSDLLFQTSDETWQAYNTYGGNSLYACSVNCPPGSPAAYKGASKVSYNRPFHSAEDDSGGRSWLMYAEYPMIRFLEANGFDVSYTTGIDVGTSTGGSLLNNHKTFLSVGHDEYWTGTQRANVEAARDKGLNLAFFSGNEVFWKTRTEASYDGTSTPNRTLVCYKETHYDGAVDPQDPPTWTGTWEDPRFSPPADGGKPQNALTGQLFVVNSGTTDIRVPAQYAKLRLWRNTTVATLSSGQTATLGAGLGTLGYEWDSDPDNGFRPAGAFRLSSTTSTSAEIFTDYGSTVQSNSTATHNMTLYRAPSGALVFGAGTVQWSWGLDPGNGPDPDMQQATVNLFADMGVQPYAVLSGLVTATGSTDTTAPTSTITSPANGATVGDGAKLTISGTATDSGGGVVAGVEVSTDGGTTWHPASGTTGWSYSWVAHGNPSTTIRSRAVDDSGNLESPSAGATVNVGCTCSIWGVGSTPGKSDSGSGSAVEVGVKFKSDVSGQVTGVRFYKASTNTGTHIGNLWTASGTKLASVTFQNESGSGWQQATFGSPVSINANTTYVVSYFAPSGHTAQDEMYLYPPPSPGPTGRSSVDSPPLHALRNTNGVVNGLYQNGSTSTFPTASTNARNYWVDVMFNPSTGPASAPGAPTSVTATPGNASALVSWTAPSDGGSPITRYTVTPYIGSTAQTPTTVTGTPPDTSVTVPGLTNGTAYTFTVTATNAVGTGPASAPSNSVTPAATSCTACTIWPASAAPSTPDENDAQSVEIGVKFKADVNGQIRGIRFYKSNLNTGTHIGSLWTLSGTKLASATFSSETSSGWQQVLFATPVTITAGTVYVASYFAPVGHYAGDGGYFAASGVDNAPLHALQDGVSGGNGVYRYTSSSAFPNSTYNSENYWVDVVFSTGASSATAPGAPTNVTATAGDKAATVSWTAPSDGGSAITSYTVTPYVGTTAQTPTTVTGSPPATTTTVNGLTNGTAYTFTVSATNAVGTGPASTPSNSVTPTASTSPTAPAAPTNVTATAGDKAATVSWTAPSDGGSAITSYTVTPYVGTTAQTPTTVTGSPPSTTATVTGLANGTTYTFTVSATNAVGTGPQSSASNAVTPAASGCAACTIWSSSATPGTASANDSKATEVGVKFKADVNGYVTGIRFYKGSGNTGTHIGNLWTLSGTRLASATFSSETSSGWQQVNFATPVAITAGTVYVASYFAPAGHFARDNNYFKTAGVDSPPLHALKDGVSGGNGVYRYSSTSAFPDSSTRAPNYWVDVVFSTG